MSFVTTLGRLFRTTAVKLTLVYLAVFAALLVGLIVYIFTMTDDLLDRQRIGAKGEPIAHGEVLETDTLGIALTHTPSSGSARNGSWYQTPMGGFWRWGSDPTVMTWAR